MKRLLIFLVFLPAFSFSQQVKISEMPTYVGNPNGAYVPIVMNNTNRKVDAAYFGYRKVDSASTSFGGIYDTTHYWKAGAKSFYTLTRASGGAGSSAWADITGKPTTLSGYGITDAFTQFLADARYSLLSHNHAFGSLTSKPTTLGGYGITDGQPLLVSGTNIKTVNGTSILGSGNLVIAGGTGTVDPTPTNGSTNAVSSDGAFDALAGKEPTIAPGANGTYYKSVNGVKTWVSDSAIIPVGPSMEYQNGFLNVSSTGAGTALYKSVSISSSAYTVAAGISVVYCNYTGGTLTVTMPTSFPVDTRITIKNFSANNVSVTSVRAGDTNLLVQNAASTYQWDGSAWVGLSKF